MCLVTVLILLPNSGPRHLLARATRESSPGEIHHTSWLHPHTHAQRLVSAGSKPALLTGGFEGRSISHIVIICLYACAVCICLINIQRMGTREKRRTGVAASHSHSESRFRATHAKTLPLEASFVINALGVGGVDEAGVTGKMILRSFARRRANQFRS